MLQLSMASGYGAVAVTEYLVGYRQLPDTMSCDGQRMAAASAVMMERVAALCPDVPSRVLGWGLGNLLLHAARREAKRGHLLASAKLMGWACKCDPRGALTGALTIAYEQLERRIPRAAAETVEVAPLYHEREPGFPPPGPPSGLLGQRMKKLAPLDAKRAPVRVLTRPSSADDDSSQSPEQRARTWAESGE